MDVWALDSVSLTTSADDGAVLMTGSHGNLLGGVPSTAVKSAPLFAVYNDAGAREEAYGWSRLSALDLRGIGGATVAAASARIGDGRSTFYDGVITHLNDNAIMLGGRVGMRARELVDLILAQPSEVP